MTRSTPHTIIEFMREMNSDVKTQGTQDRQESLSQTIQFWMGHIAFYLVLVMINMGVYYIVFDCINTSQNNNDPLYYIGVFVIICGWILSLFIAFLLFKRSVLNEMGMILSVIFNSVGLILIGICILEYNPDSLTYEIFSILLIAIGVIYLSSYIHICVSVSNCGDDQVQAIEIRAENKETQETQETQETRRTQGIQISDLSLIPNIV